jgi:hypothetical protein
MRLGARVGELRRIEVPALHSADRSRHIAIAGVRDALQRRGNFLEERISVVHRQRPGRIEDSGELEIGERNRPHVAPEGGYSPAYAIWRP